MSQEACPRLNDECPYEQLTAESAGMHEDPKTLQDPALCKMTSRDQMRGE